MRIVWSDSGRRTLKYHQMLDEPLELAEDERALVTVLLLRGPQAPGELRSRTERLHAFADRGDVEATLRRMAERGLVRELPRRGGDRDNRWIAPARRPARGGSRSQRPASTATACSPRAARRATRGCARRTTRWRSGTPTSSSTR